MQLEGGTVGASAGSDVTGLGFSTGSVMAADGLRIRYQSAGGGDPLVFVHGWCCDRGYWAPQLEHFSKSHRAVAIDLGGHGESGLGRAEWTMQAFGGDVAAILQVLDLRNAVLIGHSMGGPVIVEAALLAPDRVIALLPVDHFNDVDTPFDSARLENTLRRMHADFRGTTEELVRTFFVPHSDPALIERIARDMASAPAEVGISAFDSVQRYDEASALAKTRHPVWLINADRWPTNLDAARRHKPDIRLSLMPGHGHFPHLEAPEAFNRVLTQAISSLRIR